MHAASEIVPREPAELVREAAAVGASEDTKTASAAAAKTVPDDPAKLMREAAAVGARENTKIASAATAKTVPDAPAKPMREQPPKACAWTPKQSPAPPPN